MGALDNQGWAAHIPKLKPRERGTCRLRSPAPCVSCGPAQGSSLVQGEWRLAQPRGQGGPGLFRGPLFTLRLPRCSLSPLPPAESLGAGKASGKQKQVVYVPTSYRATQPSGAKEHRGLAIRPGQDHPDFSVKQ